MWDKGERYGGRKRLGCRMEQRDNLILSLTLERINPEFVKTKFWSEANLVHQRLSEFIK